MTYDKESLAAINARFLGTHFSLSDSDVIHANHLSELIESTRNANHPMPGDIVEFTTRQGDYYANAHIESTEENKLYICEQPYVPFMYEVNHEFYFSTSGGAWTYIPSNLKRIGSRPKCFTDWGHCGPCADGTVDFFAEVNVWEYVEPNPFFGSYTTKDYCRKYISYDPKGSYPWGDRYRGDGLAYRTEKEYFAWLMTYHGVEFEGFCENQIVVFCYREDSVLISKEEWDALDLPTDTRMMNCTIIDIKYRVNDDTHTIMEYRYTNTSDDPKSWLRRRPYEVALQRIEHEEVARKIMLKTNGRS